MAIIKKASIDKLIRKAGGKKISEDASEELARKLEWEGIDLARATVSLAEHAGKKTVEKGDVILAETGDFILVKKGAFVLAETGDFVLAETGDFVLAETGIYKMAATSRGVSSQYVADNKISNEEFVSLAERVYSKKKK